MTGHSRMPERDVNNRDLMCMCCNRVGWGPMLNNDVWHKVTEGLTHGFMCFECMELNLGREITVDDIKDVPMNDALRTLLQRIAALRGATL